MKENKCSHDDEDDEEDEDDQDEDQEEAVSCSLSIAQLFWVDKNR